MSPVSRAPDPPYPPRYARPASFWFAWILGVLLAGAVVLIGVLLFALAAMGVAEAGGGLGASEPPTVERVVDGDSAAKSAVALIDVHGLIADEEVASFPGVARVGLVRRVERFLDEAAADPDVRAVVLHIDSPGGSVTDSDRIHELVTSFKKESHKPVVAYFHSLAASGGYYVGVAADRIVAHRTCLTGSIGVILGVWNFAGAAEKLGVERVSIVSKHTPYKDMLAPDRKVSEDERAILTSIVEEMYERFVEVVDEGRPDLGRDRVRELADGRVFAAGQARSAGLVDEIGGLARAFEVACSLAGVGRARLVRYALPEPSLLQVLLGRAAGTLGAKGSSLLSLPDPAPRPMYLWTGGR